MFKYILKYFLQKVFGIELYLFLFARFVVKKLKWDKKERDFLYFLALLPDEGTILDIGANIGAMTVHMAKKHPNAKIYSFEPVPLNSKVLKKIVAFYNLKNVKTEEIALGDYTGKIKMLMPVIHSVKMHGLSHVKHPSIPGLANGKEHDVNVCKLDDIEELKDKDIKGIKLDVENFEYFVLKGGIKLIKRCKPVIYCELWNNENREKTIEFLQLVGYSVRVRISGELRSYNEKVHSTQNFFFIPEPET